MKKIICIITVLAAALAFMPGVHAQNDTAVPSMNKKNLLVKEWNTNAKGAKIIDHLTVYSPEGKKIEEIEFDSYGKQKWRKRFEWGENLRMTRELLYDEHNRLVNFKKFEYNEFGKKKTQYTYDPKGRLISTKIIEYITEDA
ncbi:MAG: RHS repeat protein [Bacteroidales bacterium]|nr:RHS repeat protein [Bacteroidales bacterium]